MVAKYVERLVAPWKVLVTAFAGVEDAVAAMAAGGMVVVVDDADRENEGDLIMTAEAATTETIGFFVRHTSGVICTPMLERAARRARPP